MRNISIVVVAAWLAACQREPQHRFTDVVDSKASPDGRIVAAQVWEDHGLGGPHNSGIVVVAKGTDPRDGEPVMLEGEDFRPLVYRWTGPDALEVRLPCGWWTHLANHWQLPRTMRVIDIAFAAPQGCIARTSRTSTLPADASQPKEVWVSPH